MSTPHLRLLKWHALGVGTFLQHGLMTRRILLNRFVLFDRPPRWQLVWVVPATALWHGTPGLQNLTGNPLPPLTSYPNAWRRNLFRLEMTARPNLPDRLTTYAGLLLCTCTKTLTTPLVLVLPIGPMVWWHPGLGHPTKLKWQLYFPLPNAPLWWILPSPMAVLTLLVITLAMVPWARLVIENNRVTCLPELWLVPNKLLFLPIPFDTIPKQEIRLTRGLIAAPKKNKSAGLPELGAILIFLAAIGWGTPLA